MKKLIFSIAALAAIVVMGSCSQDSDLTGTTTSKSKVDSVTVSLNLNSGIEVSESGSSMAQSTVNSANTSLTRAAGTRADATTGSTTNSSSASTHNPTTDFAPTYPSSYTVYFVADQAQGDYKDQEIVYTMNITADNTNLSTVTTSGSATATEVYSATGIKIPALNYKVYVTNYSTSQKAGGEFKAETLPTSSTTLYLNNGVGTTADLTSKSTNRTVDVTLTNNYAAVAVAHNDFVSAAKYNVDNNAYTDGTSDNSGLGKWYYLYVRANSASGYNDALNTNSALTIKNIASITSYTLSKTIAAGNIYQYTINDNFTGTGGNENGLTISVTPFKDAKTQDLSVYPQQ
jgi:hypothetical protein